MDNPASPVRPNFRRVAAVAQTADEYGERRREPTIVADVTIPLAQVAVVGVLTLIIWLFVLPHADQPRAYAIPIAASTMLAQWLVTLRDDDRHVVERVERSAESVPASAEPAPAAQPQVRQIRLTETHENGGHRRTRMLELPISVDTKMPDVARLVLQRGVSFSRPELQQRHRVLTQTEYRELATAMLSAGLAVRPTATQTEITAAGKSFLRGYLSGDE